MALIQEPWFHRKNIAGLEGTNKFLSGVLCPQKISVVHVGTKARLSYHRILGTSSIKSELLVANNHLALVINGST